MTTFTTSELEDLQNTGFEVLPAHGAGNCARKQIGYPLEVAGQDIPTTGKFSIVKKDRDHVVIRHSTQPGTQDQIPTSDQSPTDIETHCVNSTSCTLHPLYPHIVTVFALRQPH